MQVSLGQILIILEKEARRLRDEAGYGGRSDDGGCSRILDQAKFYKYGRDGIIPPEWSQYKLQAEREADPEWSELVRLKNKFGE